MKMQKWVCLIQISLALFVFPIQKSQGKQSSDSLLKIEYKIWVASDKNEANKWIWNLFGYYKTNKQWIEAQRTLARLNTTEMPPVQKSEVKLQNALMHYLLERFEESSKEAISIENDSLTESQKKLLYSILITSLLEKGEFVFAQKKLENYMKGTIQDSVEVQRIEKFKDQVKTLINLPLKSVNKARKLSMFIPSSGLFYAGFPKKGLTNLALQLSAAGYLAGNILFQNYATAATFNLQLLRLFYVGGVTQSEKLVKSYNKQLVKEHTLDIKRTLFSILNER
jgi:hypothetical protein